MIKISRALYRAELNPKVDPKKEVILLVWFKAREHIHSPLLDNLRYTIFLNVANIYTMKTYTREQYNSGEPVPEQVEEWIYLNSDGKMIDDDWSDYIENFLVKHFKLYEELELN